MKPGLIFRVATGRKIKPGFISYFPSAAAFRRWLTRHHQSAAEIWVGYYRKSSGTPTITWSESVDEALCFGWIDGIRKKIDERRYANRFTPRRTTAWSEVNIRRAQALIAGGRMQPAGLKAFEARDETPRGASLAEREVMSLSPELERTFRAKRTAWKFFESQPPGYRRNMIWFVMSAKQEATRARRLDIVMRVSAARRRIDPMRPLAEQV